MLTSNAALTPTLAALITQEVNALFDLAIKGRPQRKVETGFAALDKEFENNKTEYVVYVVYSESMMHAYNDVVTAFQKATAAARAASPEKSLLIVWRDAVEVDLDFDRDKVKTRIRVATNCPLEPFLTVKTEGVYA